MKKKMLSQFLHLLSQKEKLQVLQEKGKIKKIGSSAKRKEKVSMPTAEIEEDSDFEATPSPPPLKKCNAATTSKQGMKKMSPAEIAHYYSFSSEEEHLTPSHTGNQRTNVATTKKPSSKKAVAELVSEDRDIAITKEMRNTARTMKRMA